MFGNGERTRSVSESETNRISPAVLTFESNNIPPGSGLLKTPLGVGLGTHFQVQNDPLQLERKSRVERDCNNLKKDIEQWIILMKASPSPDFLVVLDGYEQFKRRIQRVSEEAILRRLSSEYTFQLSVLLVQLQSL